MRKLFLLLVVLAAGCGGGPSAPSTPPPVQAAGAWRGALRVTSGTGEPCVGAAFQSAAGVSFDYTLSVQQSGERLTATSTSPATGIVCQLAGTAGASSIVLNLTTCSNDAPPRFFSCVPDVFRDARPSALTLNANITGNSLSGTYAETYTVVVSGTTTNLGTATLNAQLTLNRQ
jgi:hypothetical protein